MYVSATRTAAAIVLSLPPLLYAFELCALVECRIAVAAARSTVSECSLLFKKVTKDDYNTVDRDVRSKGVGDGQSGVSGVYAA